MKPQIEEVEDDFAAEEENKLINEVRHSVFRQCSERIPSDCSFSTGVQDLASYTHIFSLYIVLRCGGLIHRKKNAPYLYDVVITHALDWPSLTCQWFPDKESYGLI